MISEIFNSLSGDRLASSLTIITCCLGLLAAPGRAGEIENATTKLHPFMEQAFATGLTPGMAVAVVQGEEIIYAEGFGYADVETQRTVTPETMFYIASTSKSLIAFAVAMLDHKGKLDLDGNLSGYIPGLKLHSLLVPDEITMRHLLTHTHGIGNQGPVTFRLAYTGEHTNELLLDLLRFHEPAENSRSFSYGNIGYDVAGLAMDAKFGESWKDIIQQEVLQPLGMASTTARLSDAKPDRLAMPYMPAKDGFKRVQYVKFDKNMHAAGGHLTTVLDLAKWVEVHINGGRLDGKQVFPTAVVAETHRQQAEQDRQFGNFHRHGWGLGWDLGTYDGDTLIHRFGSFPGFRSHVSFMPAHKIGVIVLVNESIVGGRLADVVACYIYDRLLDKPKVDEKYEEILAEYKQQAAQMRIGFTKHEAERASRSQDLPLPLTAYAGVYENAQLGRMKWRVSGVKLEASMGPIKFPVEVYDAQLHKLRIDFLGRGEVVRFSISNGEAVGLTYRGYEFARVSKSKP